MMTNSQTGGMQWQRRQVLELAAMLPLVPACSTGRSTSTNPKRTSRLTTPDDFDFLMGEWRVHHRRLVARLAGSDEWQEFEGSSRAFQVMDGQGNIDDNIVDIPSGQYRAITVRSFDPTSRQWAIWWLDARHAHTLEVPVKGTFRDGIGTFVADDVLDGRPIKVRFLWLDTLSGSPRWEQAFSADDGATWETNWTMQFTRT
jgi:hypothetical protein